MPFAKMTGEDKAARRQLLTVRPEEWRRRIDAVVNPAVRLQVASIVWWDIMCCVSYGWYESPVLSDLVDQWPQGGIDVPPGVIIDALVSVGYSLGLAARRAGGTDDGDRRERIRVARNERTVRDDGGDKGGVGGD